MELTMILLVMSWISVLIHLGIYTYLTGLKYQGDVGLKERRKWTGSVCCPLLLIGILTVLIFKFQIVQESGIWKDYTVIIMGTLFYFICIVIEDIINLRSDLKEKGNNKQNN